MVEKFNIAKGMGTCAKTGTAIEQGQTYYVVLYEDGETFRREEYCVDAWDNPPPGAYCHFKTRMPVKEKKKRLLVDDDVLVTFFERLKNDTQPIRLQFRFVLALILMRKRILKYIETKQQDSREYWLMRLGTGGEVHSVLNPNLRDDEIETVSKELGVILHGDAGQWDDDQEEESPSPESPADPEPSA